MCVQLMNGWLSFCCLSFFKKVSFFLGRCRCRCKHAWRLRCWDTICSNQLSRLTLFPKPHYFPYSEQSGYEVTHSLGIGQCADLHTEGSPMQVSLQLSWGGSELSTEAPLPVPLPGVPCWWRVEGVLLSSPQTLGSLPPSAARPL